MSNTFKKCQVYRISQIPKHHSVSTIEYITKFNKRNEKKLQVQFECFVKKDSTPDKRHYTLETTHMDKQKRIF